MMVAINLLKGLDKLGVKYRFNDFQYARKNPEELICVIGKTQLILDKKFKNPIIFGASVFSHPIEYPEFLAKNTNIKKILVPGPWMKKMFDIYYKKDVTISWPVGIDTEKWSPSLKLKSQLIDFLVYDKIRWQHDDYEQKLLIPILSYLEDKNYSYEIIKYGNYRSEDLVAKIGISKSVIFLCEHETQGLAYQQILSTDTPIFAWDRGGYWQDPDHFPHQVKFDEDVSSVPYWDERCGMKFRDLSEFKTLITKFVEEQKSMNFSPRKYILENLTLEKCAQRYCEIVSSLLKSSHKNLHL